ncbi:hypothetical protein PUV54_00720 [Hyphococcus flavus]|uniref:Lipoprotein n=1 Tax=Hyphococcus flavus TaxID=1866326 RepID=A0AAE9ZJJ1_9PROT|nr:hypothetical protein [Hyphococcus flavus]WDI31710.1 hypothetical protein PUV54_00720 [Hyphococcus flavus]
MSRIFSQMKIINVVITGLLSACTTATHVDTIKQYQRTSFTLSLIGQAPRLARDEVVPDMANATDVAYCAIITGDDVGRDGKLVKELRRLVPEAEVADQLLAEAAAFEYQAIDFARFSDNPNTAIYYNSGCHRRACLNARDELP